MFSMPPTPHPPPHTHTHTLLQHKMGKVAAAEISSPLINTNLRKGMQLPYKNSSTAKSPYIPDHLGTERVMTINGSMMCPMQPPPSGIPTSTAATLGSEESLIFFHLPRVRVSTDWMM